METRRRSRLITALAALLAAPLLASPPLLDAERPAAPAASAPAVAMSGADAEALARQLVPVVEELRGLTFKTPVPVRVVDDAEARRHFERRARKLWPEARARAEQTVLMQIGLLPPGTSLMTTLLDLLEEQAGGYYDPDADTFFVLGDMPRSAAPIILVHELTHALDDQHFDIDALLERNAAEDQDSVAALGAVVEGSGTLVMSVYLLREMAAGRLSMEALQEFQESEAGRAERLRAAPAYLQRALLAPYLLGQSFLLRGRLMAAAAGVPPRDLDRAFREPPASMEQILHPAKYWDPPARDLPRAVEIPDQSARIGEGWSLAARGGLGELDLALLTGSAPPDPASPASLASASWTNPAAGGWGGDRWHLYQNGGRHVTVLATLWDTEADAAEFEAALEPRDGRRAWRRADAVVVVAGDAGDRAQPIAQACLEALALAPAAR